MAKAKRIEDMSEAELTERSTKAYNKARTSPEPGGFDIKPKLEKIKADYSGRAAAAAAADRASRTNAMGDTYKNGGMTASRRADGIATKGKTKGTMIMCGGGMARGK